MRTAPEASHLNGSSEPVVSVSVAHPNDDDALNQTILFVVPLQFDNPAPVTVVRDVVAWAVRTPDTLRYPERVRFVPEALVNLRLVIVVEADLRSSAVRAPFI